jgi:hypothetical protein
MPIAQAIIAHRSTGPDIGPRRNTLFRTTYPQKPTPSDPNIDGCSNNDASQSRPSACAPRIKNPVLASIPAPACRAPGAPPKTAERPLLLPSFNRSPGQERPRPGGTARAVKAHLNGGDWQIVDELTEVESGKNSDWPTLEKALAAARLHRASLVVSSVHRLTRGVAFLSRLLEAGVEVRFADLPQIEGATERFMLQQWLPWRSWKPGSAHAAASVMEGIMIRFILSRRMR